MRNLLERLKPEYLELLEADAIKYPNIYYNIRTELTKNYFFVDLTIQTTQFMCSVFMIRFDLEKIDNLFIKDGKE
jgi:hypothetical protein